MPAGSGRYPSGQRGQTVNLLANAFGGSNPPLPTTYPGGNSSAVERQPSKLGVAGSNPVSRSIVTGAACSGPIEGGLSEARVAPMGGLNEARVAPMGGLSEARVAAMGGLSEARVAPMRLNEARVAPMGGLNEARVAAIAD